MTKVVVIGGGTGSHTLLSGLKKYPFDLTSIVTVADSGGSTGRLRDEFGSLPVGDFRMALTALAPTDEEAEILRKLFLYRFDKGEEGLKGHNFGNLFLVALGNILGSYEKAIQYTSKILRVTGKVLPITSQPVNLVAEYEDGTTLYGEANIDEPPKDHNGKQRIKKLWVEPDSVITADASYEILNADYVILGPGDLYTSLLANVVVSGTAVAIRKSRGIFIYVSNLMTKYVQTYGFSVRDHINELEKYIDRTPDYVLLDDSEFPKDVLKRYEAEDAYVVKDDLGKKEDFEIARASVLAKEEFVKNSGDLIKRSLLRHDPDKLAWEVVKIIKEHDLSVSI
ncbi:hypothetical protein A2886_03625 [candidate division WWE3 bacterium RIFCSPHIGHO2_01_FULL_42_13]|uniref:Putative gluconeogenesis factor n=1 Tax=candidate division WWE3 bacterium RIFCSPHIGHO2_01_FULL_42_13 TaxID=1802617 RepID=A0A1F4UQN4_UNCKA|nr:MAG: hypothetical protein A2886_03625 [candidate division WWE3 bacterium RIFCSPHIGHO2_01_FULL_42_13]